MLFNLLLILYCFVNGIFTHTGKTFLIKTGKQICLHFQSSSKAKCLHSIDADKQHKYRIGLHVLGIFGSDLLVWFMLFTCQSLPNVD